jgi:hypothetical protein
VTDSGLELSILDSTSQGVLIVYARCGADRAVAHLNLDAQWSRLLKFRDTLDKGLRGRGVRPANKDVDQFGHELFAFTMQGEVARLYDCVRNDKARRLISLGIFSDHADVQDVPWEYLQEPNSAGGPGARAVVRLLPTVGLAPPAPIQRADSSRVLFVSADPITQMGVSWTDVYATLDRVFSAKSPEPFKPKVVEGATRASISTALRSGDYDVFHFSGHGEVRDGQGGLILTGANEFLPADRLAGLFQANPVRLAILSACETAAGDRRQPFAAVADALIRSGTPAVVANQLPIPNATVATFVGALYDELLRSGDIDRAVTRGRQALHYELRSAEPGIEWGIPTLHRLAGGSQVYAW